MVNPTSVLIIGATGRTGSEVLNEWAKYDEISSRPDLYAFCRDENKMDSDLIGKCKGVITGDACETKDLEHAMEVSKADFVVVCIGSETLRTTEVRTDSAETLVEVLKKGDYEHVRVAVISSVGAGDSPVHIGMGKGTLMKLILRNPLKDHGGQEEALMSSPLKDRTLIVRPAGLTDNKATGNVVEFNSEEETCPTTKTDRKDLAKWLVQEAVYGKESESYFGAKPVTVTCV